MPPKAYGVVPNVDHSISSGQSLYHIVSFVSTYSGFPLAEEPKLEAAVRNRQCFSGHDLRLEAAWP